MKPILQALLVADRVYTDKLTNKQIIAGVFHNIFYGTTEAQVEEVEEVQERAPAEGDTRRRVTMRISPAGHDAGTPFCYVSMTEVYGEQQLKLRYVNLRDENVVFEGAFSVRSNDPVKTVERILPLPPLLPRREPGIYALEVLWNDEPLGSHRITISEMTRPDGGDDAGSPQWSE